MLVFSVPKRSGESAVFDSSKRFRYDPFIPDYTLKNIPGEIYQRALSASEEGCRSLNQEIIFRLKRSFDAEDARATALHARWVMEALESGPAKPFKMEELDAAFQRGASRAHSRKGKAE